MYDLSLCLTSMVASEFQGAETEVGGRGGGERARRKDGKQHRSCGSMLAIASLQAQRHTAGGWVAW